MSNYQSSFNVIDLKRHRTFTSTLPAQCMSHIVQCGLLQHDARWSEVMNIYAQAAGGVYRRHILQ